MEFVSIANWSFLRGGYEISWILRNPFDSVSSVSTIWGKKIHELVISLDNEVKEFKKAKKDTDKGMDEEILKKSGSEKNSWRKLHLVKCRSLDILRNSAGE